MGATASSQVLTETSGFWVQAREHPDKVALIAPDGTTVTYAELHDRVNRLSHYLRQLGVEHGDHLSFLLPPCDLVFAIALACTQIGVRHTPLNYHSVAAEVTYVLEDSGATVFIADERYGEIARASADAAGIDPRMRLSRGTIDGFNEIRAATADQPTAPPDDRTAGHAFLYTSGTTGKPKGVARQGPSDIEMVALQAQGLAAGWGWSGSDVHLLQAPHYHSGPYSFSTATLHLGGTVHWLEKWDARRVLEAIARHRVTTSFMVPTMFVKLLALPENVRRAADVSSLRDDAVVQSAAMCPVPVKKAMIDWWGPVFKEVYGGTEGGAAMISSREWLEHPGSVGQALPGFELRIVDEAGEDCPPGEIGTIYWVMPGTSYEYHNAPEKTQSLRLGDYVTLGDVGYVDEDGWLYLVDRRDDLINFGGTNIYPAEVEAVLVLHPAVEDVAVIGVPDEVMGQLVVAVVQTKTGTSEGPELAEELADLARQHLAAFKCPRRIEFIDVMPRTAVGKLARWHVRDDYLRRVGDRGDRDHPVAGSHEDGDADSRAMAPGRINHPDTGRPI